MSKLVCLDSQVVVWGIKGEAEAGQEAKIGRAQELIRVLAQEKATVIIPAPVVSEILLRVPKALHPKVAEQLSTRFRIAPFDTAAAVLAAQIRQDLLAEGVFKKIQKGTTREAIKFDIQIIAIARLHNVSVLYTEDNDLIKIAKGIVRTSKMPQIGRQLEADFPSEDNGSARKTLVIHGNLAEVLAVAAKQAPKAARKARKKAAPKKRKR